MLPCGPGGPSLALPWAAALLLALGAERALAIPEVQKRVRGRVEAELPAPAVRRARPPPAPSCGPPAPIASLRPPQRVAPAAPAPPYSPRNVPSALASPTTRSL